MDGEHELDPEAVLDLARRAKAALRKRARTLRASLPPAAVAARSDAIVRRLQALEPVLSAGTIALFDPILDRREVDLRPLARWADERGVRVHYPLVDRAAGAMTFRRAGEGDLADRGLGIREPSPEAPEAAALDVVVVPALMADARGHRLGYGAGYYDRTLPRFRPPAVAVVVAFDFQLAADLPVAPHDVACDFVVTDERTIEVAARGGG